MTEKKFATPTLLDHHPLWNLGFRPFFLFASLFATIAITLWLLVFSQALTPLGPFDPVLWHAHEMIYGYTTAVIAGFILTASQNWTGRPGVKGRTLKLLFFIWIAGRLLMTLSSGPGLIVSLVDLAFYPALAFVMIPYLKPEDMKVERVFFAYFGLYLFGNILMHLESLHVIQGYARSGALLGLNTTILMIVFMGGRLIPFFTESEIAKMQPRTYPWIEFASHGSAWAFLITQFFVPNSALSIGIAFVASLIHLARLRGWYVKRVRRIGLLWVLHSSYLWIALGFSLVGFSSMGILPFGSAVHALTVGGLGIVTFGMMTRVALGHTGRRLYPHKLIIGCYSLLNVTCVIRVFGPSFFPAHQSTWIFMSGALWVVSFIGMLTVYAPMLVRARVDGKLG